MSDLLTREEIEEWRSKLNDIRPEWCYWKGQEAAINALCNQALLALKDEPEPQQQQPSVDLAPTSSGALPDTTSRAARTETIEECIVACEAQRVDTDEHGDPMGDEDHAYNQAITDCCAAISMLPLRAPVPCGGQDAGSEPEQNKQNAVVQDEPEGWVSVPVAKLRRYELMFEVGATTGIDAYSVDGTKTANAQICRECSDELASMLAAKPSRG